METTLIQFEDRDGSSLSEIMQVPLVIDAGQLKSLINTTRDLYFDGKLISGTLETVFTANQRNDSEAVKKIRLCEELPAAQPALFCASTYSGHEGPVLAVKLAGRLLLSAGGDRTVRFWDTLTRTQSHIARHHAHWVLSVDCDGTRVVTGGMDKLVNVYDTTGKHIRSLARHRAGVCAVRILGETIVSVGRDGIACVWRADGELAVSWAHAAPIKALCVARVADDDFVITGAADGSLRVYKNGSHLCDLRGHSAQINAVELSGRYAVSADDAGCIIVWKDWAPHRRLRHKREVISLAVAPSGQSFASGSFDRTVVLWSLESGEVLATYLHASAVYRVRVFSDLIVSAGKDRMLKAFRISTKRLVSDLVCTDEVYDFDYNDGLLVAGSRDGTIQFFN